jgi:hypothetical protein
MPKLIRLGFTSTGFVMLTDDEVVGVDLLMLATAQWRHTEGKLPSVFITWLGDTVPAMGGITVGQSTDSTITEAFVRTLEAAADRRKAEFPSEVREAVDKWRGEIWRRNDEDHDPGQATRAGWASCSLC